MSEQSTRAEAILIAQHLIAALPPYVDGREAIVEMRDSGSRHWRQMEWIGFYLEFLMETKVVPALGLQVGPTFGKTTFDYELRHVWDLKTHPVSTPTAPMNDQQAVRNCITRHGGLGFLIVEVDAEYDDDLGTFKAWHDQIKGKRSSYESERIARGAPSRRRKSSFRPTSILAIYFASLEDLQRGLAETWLSEFQKGMRNSDGSPRRAKFMITPSQVPDSAVVARVTYPK